MRASKLYDVKIASVCEFRDRYIELVNLMERGRKPGTMTLASLTPKNGNARAVNELLPKVARAAGGAAQVGEPRRVQIAQFGQTMSIDPIIAWQHSLDMPDRLPPQIVIDSCEGIIGSLTAKRDHARAIERSPAGWIASFVGFPARVRTAVLVQNPDSHTLGRVAFGAGILGQIVVAVVATAVGALLVQAVSATF